MAKYSNTTKKKTFSNGTAKIFWQYSGTLTYFDAAEGDFRHLSITAINMPEHSNVTLFIMTLFSHQTCLSTGFHYVQKVSEWKVLPNDVTENISIHKVQISCSTLYGISN